MNVTSMILAVICLLGALSNEWFIFLLFLYFMFMVSNALSIFRRHASMKNFGSPTAT